MILLYQKYTKKARGFGKSDLLFLVRKSIIETKMLQCFFQKTVTQPRGIPSDKVKGQNTPGKEGSGYDRRKGSPADVREPR